MISDEIVVYEVVYTSYPYRSLWSYLFKFFGFLAEINPGGQRDFDRSLNTENEDE